MIQAVIEIPQNSIFKYERDKATGALFLDRPLNQPCPYNYGYIPGTLCGDGDPLDVFVLGNAPIFPLAGVRLKVLGAFKCTDNGESDDKIIAVLEGDIDGSEHMGTDIIRTYLKSYKTGFVIEQVLDQNAAMDLIAEAQQEFINKELRELRNGR